MQNSLWLNAVVCSLPQTLAPGYLEFDVCCPRLSGYGDRIAVRMLQNVWKEQIRLGDMLSITGSLYSRYRPGAKSGQRLTLYCRAQQVTRCQSVGKNQVIVEGSIRAIAPPRLTPGGWEIIDLLLCVPRKDTNQCDYLPCIAWRQLARLLQEKRRGDSVVAQGRVQSRVYYKNQLPMTVRELSLQQLR